MTTTKLGFLLAVVLIVSCATSHSVDRGTQKIGPEIGYVTLSSSAPQTEARGTAIRVTGTTASGAVAFSSIDQRRPEIRWEMPTTVLRLVIESLGSQSVMDVVSLPIALKAGQNLALSEPDLQTAAAPLSGIELSAEQTTIPLDFAPRLRARGTFTDGSTADLSHSVVWLSLAPATARIDSRGLLSPQAAGAVTVRADLLDHKAHLSLTISNARLKKLLVEPGSLKLAAATSATLRALGRFSDGSLLPIVDGVGWESSMEAIATIDGSGRLVGQNPGDTNVTATYRGQSAFTVVTVSSANLQSLMVTPASDTGQAGQVVRFLATGHFSDKTSQDLTDFVTWGSSNPELAVVDKYGLATALEAGRALIIANDPESPMVASATLTVTSRPVASPAATSLAFGDVPHTVEAGATLGAVTVTVLDQFGHPIAVPGNVTLSLGKPPAIPNQAGFPNGNPSRGSAVSHVETATAGRQPRSGLVGTLSKDLLDGSASFDLKVLASGAFVLQARMNGVQAATSNIFVAKAPP